MFNQGICSFPSAISSQAWRSYYLNKEKNENIENIKRKEQRISSKKRQDENIKNN